MKYLLDTNICVYLFGRKHGIAEKLDLIGFDQCAISEITLAEMIFGAYKSLRLRDNINVIDSLLEKVPVLSISNTTHIFGREKARLQKLGMPISDFDLLIGSTAIFNDLILVTRNIGEFRRMENLKLENWADG